MTEIEISFKVLISAALLGLGIWSTVWVYNDSQQEGKPGCLVAFLVAMTWPLGLFLWLIVRSEKREEAESGPDHRITSQRLP